MPKTFSVLPYKGKKGSNQQFIFGRKLVIDIFWDIQDILYHVNKHLESILLFFFFKKIMGCL